MFKIEKLIKKFDNRYIFKETNLCLEKGKSYALIGKSGSGKTTLLNILAQLETYQTGEILYRNKPLKRIKAQRYFREHLGYLFQNFGLLENETIAKNLELGLINRKLSKPEKLKCVEDVLSKVGLSYLDLNTKIYTLSGGESQRVAIAKIILKNPPVILADEPTASLDPETSREIITLLLSLQSEHNVIVIATHNQEVWNMCDEIIEIAKISNVD